MVIKSGQLTIFIEALIPPRKTIPQVLRHKYDRFRNRISVNVPQLPSRVLYRVITQQSMFHHSLPEVRRRLDAPDERRRQYLDWMVLKAAIEGAEGGLGVHGWVEESVYEAVCIIIIIVVL